MATNGIREIKEVSKEAQQAQQDISDDAVSVIKVGKHTFRIRGLRAKAQSIISRIALKREVVKPDSDTKSTLDAMKKYNDVPYKVLSVAVLNNFWALLYLPFVHKIHTFYLKCVLDQRDVAEVMSKVIEKANMNAFFLNIWLIESLMDTRITMTKKEVGQLYQEQVLAQKENQ